MLAFKNTLMSINTWADNKNRKSYFTHLVVAFSSYHLQFVYLRSNDVVFFKYSIHTYRMNIDNRQFGDSSKFRYKRKQGVKHKSI